MYYYNFLYIILNKNYDIYRNNVLQIYYKSFHNKVPEYKYIISIKIHIRFYIYGYLSFGGENNICAKILNTKRNINQIDFINN